MSNVEDILTETPRPTWSFRPGYGAPLPDEVTLGRPSSGYTPDPASGIYESVPSGEKRIFGPQQRLLVEAGGRTNHVLQSADISSWNLSGGTNGVSTSALSSSLIDGETAHEVTGGGSADDFAYQSAGTFSGNVEVAHIHVQRCTSDRIAFGVQNTSTGNVVALVEYDLANEATTVQGGSVRRDHIRVLGDNGSGEEAIHFIIHIGPGNGENTAGENRQIRVYPDRNGNGNSVVFHHAQIEQSPGATSPIVTGSSDEGRDPDDVSVDLENVFNSKEGTLSVVFTPLFSYYNDDQELISRPQGQSYLKIRRNSFPKPLTTYDGDNQVKVGNAIKKFQKNKVAVSFTPNESRLAANGEVKVGPHNGSLLNGSTLEIGRAKDLQAAIDNIAYRSRALSESALKTLTTGNTERSTSVVSPPTLSSSSSSSLLQETQDFETRVQNDGGSIESGSLENLYDAILRKIKSFSGVSLSDLVFFGAASAVKDNSGSIPKLYDASGDENDAIQSDSAKQHTKETRSDFGGRWVAAGDGTDDLAPVNSGAGLTQPCTIISIYRDGGSDFARIIDDQGLTSGKRIILGQNGRYIPRLYAGSEINTGTNRSGEVVVQAGRADGSNSLVMTRQNTASGDPGTNDLGEIAVFPADKNPTYGGTLIAINAGLTQTQINDIFSVLASYYDQ